MSWCLPALISYLYIIIYTDSTQPDICVWGRTGNTTTYLNGLYTYYQPNNDDLPYYQKLDTNCTANDLYLYLNKNTWHIGRILGNTTNYAAICNSPTYLDTPDQCDSNWEVNGIVDTSMSATQGLCPVLECEQLEVVYYSNTHCRLSPDDCCGPFYRYNNNNNNNNNNVYFKQTNDGGRYLYFSVNDFRWICSKSVDDVTVTGECQNLATSPTIDAYSLHPKWINLKPQQIRKFSWSSNMNKTVYIKCVTMAPTPTPTKTPIIDYQISGNDLNDFKTEIENEFDNSGNNLPLLASSVRLVFNDCVGPKEWIDDEEIAMYSISNKKPFEYNTICDGCINYINDNFHNGLYKLAVEKLEYIYENSWNKKMSRADFWMAVGTVAIEYSITLSSITNSLEKDMYGKYPYFFGRRTCTQSPMININETSAKDFDFDNFQQIVDFFSDHLNFTTEEMLTLIGAHTLGTTHQLYSGFSASWTDNVYEFDNSYYNSLLNYEWKLSDDELHWIKSDGGYNMLNEDIFIGYDVSDYYNDITGIYTNQCVVNKASSSSLSYDTCPIRTNTKSLLKEYENNNELFLKNFQKVWIKLITIGYDDDDLYRIESDGNTPTPDTTQTDIGYVVYYRNGIIVMLTTIYCIFHL